MDKCKDGGMYILCLVFSLLQLYLTGFWSLVNINVNRAPNFIYQSIRRGIEKKNEIVAAKLVGVTVQLNYQI